MRDISKEIKGFRKMLTSSGKNRECSPSWEGGSYIQAVAGGFREGNSVRETESELEAPRHSASWDPAGGETNVRLTG